MVLLPLQSFAQSESTFIFRGGNYLGINWTQPDAARDRIDCRATTDTHCQSLNRSLCPPDGTPSMDLRYIEIELVRMADTPTILPNSKLYVWIERSNSTGPCEYNSLQASTTRALLIDPISLSTFSPLVTGQGTFIFPTTVSAPLVRASELLLGGLMFGDVAPNACTTPVENVYRLCFGIDMVDLLGGSDDKIIGSEPSAWIRIPVFTILPPSPLEVSVESLDNRLKLLLTPPINLRDTDEWIVHSRILPDEATSVPSIDCANLPSDLTKQTANAKSNSSMLIKGENGKVTEGCVSLIDLVGNIGPGIPFLGTPEGQCGFIECYPENGLKGGYCGAAPVPFLAALVLCLRMVWRRRWTGRS